MRVANDNKHTDYTSTTSCLREQLEPDAGDVSSKHRLKNLSPK